MSRGASSGLAVIAAVGLLFGPHGLVPIGAQGGDGRVTVIISLKDVPGSRPGSGGLAALQHELDAEAADEARARWDAKVREQVARAHAPARQRVDHEVRRLGGDVVYDLRGSGVIVARVPESGIQTLEHLSDVASVERDRRHTALLEIAVPSMLANTFWTAGLTGGPVDVAVVDSGVYTENAALTTRASSILGAIFHDAARLTLDYCDVELSTDDFTGHGTVVAGMVFSQGAAGATSRKGVAYGIDKLYNRKAGYLTCSGGGAALDSDTMAAMHSAVFETDPPEVINFSYGSVANSDDDGLARFMDGLVDAYGKVVTIAAGNDGPATAVASPSIAWNVLSIANVDDGRTTSRADDVIRTSSSRGPTPGGRKKPDLAAPGTNISSTSTFGGWSSATGTSFSAPAVAGAASLLVQAGVNDPRAVRAVLINTADDLGAAGWDPAWGWGYYNGLRAYNWRTYWAIFTMAAPGAAGQVRFFERQAAVATKATIAWNRAVSYVGPSYPSSGWVNNVDLYLYDRAAGVLRASSAAPADNVEQVTSALAEPVVLAVRSAGSFSRATELVALAHSGGFVERGGPGVGVVLSYPASVDPGALFQVQAVVTNGGDLLGHQYAVTLSLPAGFSIEAGANPQVLGSLAPGFSAQGAWTVRAPPAPQGATSLSAIGQSSSYGWVWTLPVPGPSIRVGAGSPRSDYDGDGIADVAVFRPSVGTWYLSRSSGGSVGVAWGASGDVPVPADYDGDARTDLAVFRPANGAWYVAKSTGGAVATLWGTAGDTPAPGDYDGDGRADVAVFRASANAWYIVRSSMGTAYGVIWGDAGDLPVPADYDGDGKTDVAVFRGSNHAWYVVKSSTGTAIGFLWGDVGDIPVVADYDGDGKADVGVFRGSNHAWYIIRSTTGTAVGFLWGDTGDVPVFGDYDGDGKADVAVFRPSTGAWYIMKSTGGSVGLFWGAAGDLPV